MGKNDPFWMQDLAGKIGTIIGGLLVACVPLSLLLMFIWAFRR